MLVRELEINDQVKFKDIIIKVREIKSDRVMVSKLHGQGLFSIPFITHHFEDNQNRVELA